MGWAGLGGLPAWRLARFGIGALWAGWLAWAAVELKAGERRRDNVFLAFHVACVAVGWVSSHTCNECNESWKLMKMQFETKFTQVLFILFLRV